MNRKSLTTLMLLACAVAVRATTLIELSIPVNSMDAPCEPYNSGVWSVAGNPAPDNIGIGYLVNANPTNPGFVLHDHVYVSAYIPDPSRAIITFRFDQAVFVTGLSVIEHTRGITKIEGFSGDVLGSMTSVGNVFGTKGDVTGWTEFAEYESNAFSFNSAASGQYFQAVVRKTSWLDGWAAYRMYLDVQAVPEPASLAVVGLGLAAIIRRKRPR